MRTTVVLNAESLANIEKELERRMDNDASAGSDLPIAESHKKKLKRLRKKQREHERRIATLKEEMKEEKEDLALIVEQIGIAIDAIDQADLPFTAAKGKDDQAAFVEEVGKALEDAGVEVERNVSVGGAS